MTLHTLPGTLHRQDEILDVFFDDIARSGWRHLSDAMYWVQLMELGRERYYIVGSRAMGCHHAQSDLDILCSSDTGVFEDFKLGGVNLLHHLKDFRKTDHYGCTRGPNPKLWGLAKLPGHSIEIQLRKDAADWKRVWEHVLQHHRNEMCALAGLAKSEKRVRQTFIMKMAEYDLGISVRLPETPVVMSAISSTVSFGTRVLSCKDAYP